MTVTATPWTPLYERAKKMLCSIHDNLSDQERDYLVSIEARKVVWGTPFMKQFITQVENKHGVKRDE